MYKKIKSPAERITRTRIKLLFDGVITSCPEATPKVGSLCEVRDGRFYYGPSLVEMLSDKQLSEVIARTHR